MFVENPVEKIAARGIHSSIESNESNLSSQVRISWLANGFSQKPEIRSKGLCFFNGEKIGFELCNIFSWRKIIQKLREKERDKRDKMNR